MAALTTPIVRGNMRLYPGMPVHRKQPPNVRKRAANLNKSAGSLNSQRSSGMTSGNGNTGIAKFNPRPVDSRSLNACSAFDITFDSNGNTCTPMARPIKPTPLSVSQQYLNARRRIPHKPMTEEQQRRRTKSLYGQMPPEGQECPKEEENGNNGRKGLRKKSSSIRRFFQKFRISNSGDNKNEVNSNAATTTTTAAPTSPTATTTTPPSSTTVATGTQPVPTVSPPIPEAVEKSVANTGAPGGSPTPSMSTPTAIKFDLGAPPSPVGKIFPGLPGSPVRSPPSTTPGGLETIKSEREMTSLGRGSTEEIRDSSSSNIDDVISEE